MGSVQEIKRRHESRLMKMRGVVGVGIGMKDGKEVIRVFVNEDNPKTRGALPVSLEEIPVEIVVTGPFTAR